MSSNRSGFTIIEMLIAIIILSVGFLALGAGLGRVTQTLSTSRLTTEANQLATRRMDRLRAASRSTAIPCTSTSFSSSGSAIESNGVSIEWVVPPSGTLRRVLIIATYAVAHNKDRADTLATNISCA